MDKLNEYLKTLLSTCSYELHLEPNKTPYVVSDNGISEVANAPILGTQISMMIFPLIPTPVRMELPNKSEIEFVHNHNLGKFGFLVRKSPAGFEVTIRPMLQDSFALFEETPLTSAAILPTIVDSAPVAVASFSNTVEQKQGLPATKPQTFSFEEVSAAPEPEDLSSAEIEIEEIEEVETAYDSRAELSHAFIPAFPKISEDNQTSEYAPPSSQPVKPVEQIDVAPSPAPVQINPAAEMRRRMNALFYKMAEVGASDLHLSVSMSPMMRQDGKIKEMECREQVLTPEVLKDLLTSIMPPKNLEEFDRRHDTDFAYEIEDLARFRANIFMDRKGMGGVFRIIPAKMTTVEQLGLSPAVLKMCELSKGLVVVTGPTGSGKSTTLCALVNHINFSREEHIITIEDPIEFTHENQKCLINQREIHNHTDSFKDALRAALREDPDILLVGEMRDLETIAIAIETAETGHLVFGTLHTTTAVSTIDRIIDQFPADRQQQIRVMLSESLKGVIAQTLLPKKGGGRVAALEILIVTPAISNLIREGKTFQIQSAMQTGKQHGMVMLNDALFDLVNKGIVEPRQAYLKAVDKLNFEAMLKRSGFKI